MDLEHALQHGGGTARRSMLRSLGFTDRDLARAVAAGRLRRLRPGLYAPPGLEDVVAVAHRRRGTPACVSLLRSRGVWVPPDDHRTHVLLPKSAPSPRGSQLVVHRARRSGPVSAATALRQMLDCSGREMAVASLDSALRLGLISESELLALPRAMRERADPRCESGGESLVRQRLAARNIRAVPQVQIPGVGRVDFVVGDRLVIEIDGYEFHSSREAFERDRERDRALVEAGYLVIRLTLRQVLEDWDRVERSLRAIVRSRRHCRPA